jgi:hypothetical protein
MHEQYDKYSSSMKSHQVDFKSQKGLKKILEIEGLVRMIYKE